MQKVVKQRNDLKMKRRRMERIRKMLTFILVPSNCKRKKKKKRCKIQKQI